MTAPLTTPIQNTQ